MRFHGALSDAGIEKYCSEINWARAVVFGAFSGRMLVGVAEAMLDRLLLCDNVEVSVSVSPLSQNHGVGTELVRRATEFARNRGAKKATFTYLLDNMRMERLAKRFAGRRCVEANGVISTVNLLRPTFVSLWSEATSDVFSVFNYLTRTDIYPFILVDK